MFNKKFRKYLSISVILLVVFTRVMGPVSILAQEADPTPTPTPTETQTVDPTPTPTDSPAITSVDPTPTPTPTDTSADLTNSGEVNNTIDSGANTGDNSATQVDPTPTPTDSLTSEATDSAELNNTTATQSGELDTSQAQNSGDSAGSGDSSSASVETGDAAAITVVENQVNTTVVNSTVYHHTLNLFISEDGDLDLSDPFAIASNIVTTEENADSTVNVLATSVDNYTTLSNDVVSIANTGANTIEGSMEATINTGNAISVVSLLNQVNFTIEGSTLHFVTINVFGKLTGNIILPEFSSLDACNECGMSVNAENQAVVNNNVNSEANTGENEIVYEENGSITTGDAASVVNLTNWINTNIVGLLIFNLVINVFGQWNGQFLGWGDIPAGDGLTFNFISSNGGGGNGCCPSGDLSISNQAYVNNNISSLASTGENSINAQNASINTGRAVSIISLANFVNTNFIRSIGFFGFLNIFGEWNGDIGGASKFITPTPTPPDGEEESVVEPSDYSRENGGQLLVTNTNNVGAYVNPGDTVTFFMDVKNPGNGKVYDVKLHLFLVYNGQNVGGTYFDLGEIQAGKKTKVTTGFVLSKTAPEGQYTAVAHATGETGNGTIKDMAESYFQIGTGFLTASVESLQKEGPKSNPSVLGQTNTQEAGTSAQNMVLLALFAFFSSTYLLIRIVKKREYLAELFAKGLTFKERVYSFRLFLL